MGIPEYYSVEELTGILGLHPKTIRRFINEGKIRGRKIGRAWKVHHDDLRDYAHGELNSPADADRPVLRSYDSRSPAERLTVSAVVELQEKDADEASRISNSLMAMLNCKDPAWGPVRYDMVHYPESGKARFVLHGRPAFIRELMVFFEVIAEQTEGA